MAETPIEAICRICAHAGNDPAKVQEYLDHVALNDDLPYNVTVALSTLLLPPTYTYVDDLLTKVRRDVNSNIDCGDAILSLFTPAVTLVFEWKEEDYSGTAFAVYMYKRKYFYLSAIFGSCDDVDVDELKYDIMHRTTFVHSIHEITFPFESKHTHPDLVQAWTAKLKELGGEELYQKCYDLANELCVARELDAALLKEKEQKQKADAHDEKKRAAIEQRKAIEQDARDLIAWFEHRTDDPFYEEKLPSKYRQLQFYMRNIHDQRLIEMHEYFISTPLRTISELSQSVCTCPHGVQ